MSEIQKLMLSMFISLRVGVGIVGIALPIVLVGAGGFLGVPLAGTMSAYYHANRDCAMPDQNSCADKGNHQQPCANTAPGQGPMRNWFVGSMFFMGAAMFLIKGFSRVEDWVLNIAGVAAAGVALIPMSWPCQLPYPSPHFVCAAIFFFCVAFTCIFCSRKTLKEMPPAPDRERVIRHYRNVYRFLAFLMVALPVAGWVTAYNSGHQSLALETGGVWAFGIYWLVKTRELKHSDVERRIMNGQLEMNPRTLR